MIFWKDFNLGTILFVYFFALLFVAPAHSNQQQTLPTQKENPQKIQVALSEAEKIFLQNHPAIRLGTDHRWEPYVIKKSDGSLEGFDIDLLRIINDMTGANIQIATGRWAEIVELAKDREIDGLANSTANKEREPFFNFSAPYVQVFPAFVVKHDSTFNIQSVDGLSGKSVAILKGNQFYLSLLKNYPTINVMEAPSEADAIKLTIEGKADASIVATTSYNTHYKVFSNLIRIDYIATDNPLNLVYSVRKDWPELKSILNKGLAVISQETYNELYYKWFNMEPVRLVQRDKEIRTVIVDNYFPYTFVNDKGEPDGFSVDLIKAVAKELGMNIKIRVEVWDNALKKLLNDEINLLPMMAYSEERDEKFDFSPPHTIAYDAYFTRKGFQKIKNSKDLKGKKIIVMKNDRAHDHLKSIPFITDDHLIFENSTAEALKKLSSGIGDTAVMPKVLGLVLVNKLKLENVDTLPTTIQNYQRSFSFAVNEGNSDLLVRLENGLQIIKETGEYKKLHDKWLGVYEPHEVSFGDVLKYFLWVILAFALVSSILILWTVTLKRQVSHRTKKLEQEIDERKQVEEALGASEERFRHLSEATFEAIVFHDEGIILQANNQYYEMFGYTPDELADKNAIMLTATPDSNELMRHQISLGNLGPYEVMGLKKGEIEFPMEIRAKVTEYHGRKISMAAIRDLTERKQAEDQIKAALKEKEVLLSEIHHRVKNNMQVIISLLKLQSDKIEDKKYAEMLQESQDRIRSMALVHEQLYMSKDFANIDFGEYVKSFVNTLFVSHGVDTNKIKLNVEIENISFDLENAIPCGLIINELVSNSLKHAFPQGKEGKISIALRSTNEDELELTVSDSGVGIPEDLDIRDTESMGLHLVRVLAEQTLEGKMELNRTEGTQFHFQLKRSKYKPRI